MEQSLTNTQFWTGIAVLVRNYHAINKHIFACVLKEVYIINKGITKVQKSYVNCVTPTWHALTAANAEVEGYACVETEMEMLLKSKSQGDVTSTDCEGLLIYYKFLNKKLKDNIEAVGLIDFSMNSYTCKFDCPNLNDFVVKLINNNLVTETLNTHLDPAQGIRWAEFVLKPKLLKWCKPTENVTGKQHTSSLQLIDIEAYNDLYKQLKRKYAEKALKCWHAAKESTDPLKFVYEDLAIAAYLISLWQRVGVPSAFADLGCGNGLLVYLLTEEGYRGYGYDVRARKIWAYYPPNIQLIEQTIDPSSFQLPAEVDWLIGNHSDELSPWLPVLAALANYQTRFFLLPCCAYELSGAKFQRRTSSISGYQDFYAYLQVLAAKCGYKTMQDRLKIPSTKRLALIGVDRTHMQNEYAQKRTEIASFVSEERRKYYCKKATDEVKLRDRQEAVRNCTQIDKKVIDMLVLKIFSMLLAAVDNRSDEIVLWQPGGCLSLREIANKLSSDDLAHIKAECGGVKTLLRNRHEIFEFRGSDLVGIRKPKMRDINKTQTLKKRTCFFQRYHPNGCPLNADDCTFIH